MKKLLSLLFAVLLTISGLAGCSDQSAKQEENQSSDQSAQPTDENAFPVTITDALDHEVTIEETPKRIVSLIPSNTEVIYELGLEKEIVGVSDFDNYPKEVSDKEKVGGQEINVEKIISLNPDLVLAHESGAQLASEALQQLRDSGIAVIVVNEAANFEEVYDSITMIGKATGKADKASETINDMKKQVEEVKKKVAEVDEQKSVFVEVSPEPEIYTPGKNTFMHEMLQIINAINASADIDGWAKIDQETIIDKNPDVIITTYGYYTENPKQQVLNREGWSKVTAVESDQVHDVHSDLVTRSGPRLVEGVEQLAKAVYPEVFSE
ncbi:ABC transporter substrate-binding protein [Pseudalkalibacillus berkeleyi]|uniref:ABC transporter substrate-binding protein n=1 Tax=Pseudalkalibacillus berkeleyi TaxID=1069813 RepID=A0ABS9H116_9BACL|nr:ABC transporter substrate-binding protein [Pseudalkalibacillus berkeleyi]MCF6137468.1 ABC transporter substrate-binding protein [Pseudalkalibacillus berkeleyi]